jgi:hypothetical protein
MIDSITHRTVIPEWLDELSPEDPLAIASRRDLRLLNLWMGNARTVGNVLAKWSFLKSPIRMAELGAGDGTFFLRVARVLHRQRASGKIFLVDKHPSISPRTLADLNTLGWDVEVIAADVFDWLPQQRGFDAVISNLFLHHFEPPALSGLLGLISQSSGAIVACEPRRCLAALATGSMLRLLGCNAVTRHDAPISVRAGFRGQELSAAWPHSRWQLREQRAGLFSHLFVARHPPS